MVTKKKTINFCLWILMVATMSPSITAQHNKIVLDGKVNQDSLVLRWAPVDVATFSAARDYGYKIVRTLATDTTSRTIDNIKNAPLSEWKKYDRRAEKKYLILGASALFDLTDHASRLTAEEEMESKFTTALFAADMDPLVAELMGLRCAVKLEDENETFLYQVIITTDSDSVVGTSNLFSARKGMEEREIPIWLDPVIEEEGKVTLSWRTHPEFLTYTAYFIERSDNGNDFYKMNEVPYVFTPDADSIYSGDRIYFRDSVSNYDPHYYRIRGIDHFGDLGPYTEVVQGMARDRTPPESAVNLSYEWVGETEFELSYTLPDDDDIISVDIKKTLRIDLPSEIRNDSPLKPSSSSFRDTLDDIYESYLYYVCTIDSVGNEAKSDPIMVMKPNTEPPATPTGLSGVIDSSGVLTLTWDSNHEDDLWGYIVFMANDKDHVFSRIVGSPIRNSQFIDTVPMNFFDDQVYYKVAALDLPGNISPPTEMVAVSRPDLIPPSNPVFKDYEVTDEGISLTWTPSMSLDVVEHRLLRRKKGEKEWQLLEAYTPVGVTYMDRDLIPDHYYEYTLLAMDEVGNKSESINTVTLKSKRIKSNHQVHNLRIEAGDNGSGILSWDYSTADKVRFLIYKRNAQGKYTIWKKTESNRIDISGKRMKEDSFKVRVQLYNGKKGAFSQAVKLNVN